MATLHQEVDATRVGERAAATDRHAGDESDWLRVRDVVPLVILVAAFAVCRWLIAGPLVLFVPLLVMVGFVGARLALVGGLFLAAHHVWPSRRPRGIRLLDWRFWRPFVALLPRCAASAVVLVALCVGVQIVFLNWKTDLGLTVPFRWDSALAALDARLHFGVQPWRLLWPVFGHPSTHRALEVLYGPAWYSLVYLGAPLWAGMARGGALQRRFLWAYALLWIVAGTILARVFSSAGPIYYAHVTGDPAPYGALVGWMEALPPHAFAVRDIAASLWTALAGREPVRIGISAMPSLHVASATLTALWACRVNRALGVLYVAFAVVIAVGSVALAWHYAVDAYAGAALGALAWWAGGYIVRWGA
ncbi:MAG: phosphatase PAP2 family protein, partial [Gemmatimonadetes bacterium]|nr:phosphatase PAP2 family protein [Gemmatimonadota bacterium]